MVKIKVRDQQPTKRESRKKLILPIFLGLIMVLSIFGYIVGQNTQGSDAPSTEEKSYGGYEFQRTTGGWFANVGDRQIMFRYLPDELLDVDVSLVPRDALNRKKIYLAVDLSKRFTLAERDVYYNLKPLSNLQVACVEDHEGCETMPLKTCTDADDSVAVVVLRSSNQSGVTYENNCIVVAGDEIFVTKAIDKILYAFFSIE